MYLFRIEDNLLDATVCYTFSKKRAVETIKRGYFSKKDKKDIFKIEADAYAAIMTPMKGYPAPYEIVEFGIVRRYKI